MCADITQGKHEILLPIFELPFFPASVSHILRLFLFVFHHLTVSSVVYISCCSVIAASVLFSPKNA